MSYNSLGVVDIVLDIFVLIQTITSAVMCVYGYKWANKLIAIMSGYIGIMLGVILAGVLLNAGAGLWSVWIVPICYFAFMWSAYKIMWLNHFCAGFLIAMKIMYMILYTLMERGAMDSSVGTLLGAPVIVGVIVGILISSIYNNYVLLLCVSYIGATELVPRIVSFINKGLFAATGDLSYVFNPLDFLLGLFGIETASLLEVVGIIGVFIISFLWQRHLAILNNIDLSGRLIDDRNYHRK